MPVRFAAVRILVLAAAVGMAVQAQAPEPRTLAECLKAARDYVSRTYQAERAAGRTPDLSAITRQKVEIARQYAARFPLDAVSGEDLLTLARLHAEAGDQDMAARAVAKRLSSPGLSDPDRAAALVAGAEVSMASPVTEASVQRAEEYVRELDRVPGALRQRLDAHVRLGAYFRGGDVDEKILLHMGEVIGLSRQIAPDERKALGYRLANAYTSVAEVQAGRGAMADVFATLQAGLKELAGVPQADEMLRSTQARYELVGKPGAPVEAPDWLNAAPGTKRIEPAGQVTVLQFTAHWCGPCRKSYPAMVRLHGQLGARGLRVLFSTQLYGFFEKRQNLSRDEEIAADRQYYEHHGIAFPISIEPRKVRQAGSGQAPAGPAFTEDRYLVYGIPQIVVLDKKGIVRRILIGWDPAAEAGLREFLEKLLGE